MPQRLVEQLPSLPVILGQSIFEYDERILLRPVGIHGHHFCRGCLAPLGPQVVQTALIEPAGRWVKGDRNLFTRLVSRLFDGTDNQLDGICVVFESGCESPFVADPRRVSRFLEDALKGVVRFARPAHGLTERRSSHRSDHELLEVGPLPVGMDPAVHDVEHGHRQDCGGHSTDVAIQWQVAGKSRHARHGEAHTQQCIRTKPALVGGSVQLDHAVVDAGLVCRVHPRQRCCNLCVDMLHGLEDPLAAKTALVPVPKLQRLMDTCRCPRRNSRPCHAAIFQRHLYLDGRVSPGVENLPCMYCLNCCSHCRSS